MSAVVLQGLLDYLRSTLTIDNRRWLAAHLVEPSEILEPYTSEELRTRIETAEADIAAGRYYSEEEMEELMDKALVELKTRGESRRSRLKIRCTKINNISKIIYSFN